jgi:hypothetical protein
MRRIFAPNVDHEYPLPAGQSVIPESSILVSAISVGRSQVISERHNRQSLGTSLDSVLSIDMGAFYVLWHNRPMWGPGNYKNHRT